MQVYAPHTVPKVLALVNGPITHDELGDGHGTSHYSKVTYTKITNPFRATVTNVRIGGRHPDNGFCWDKEKWKSKYTKYRRWNGSSWQTNKTESDSSWRTSGTPNLAYFNLGDNVYLATGALVQNELSYTFNNWCLAETRTFSGWRHNHYLE